jgi:hypothetical protein
VEALIIFAVVLTAVLAVALEAAWTRRGAPRWQLSLALAVGLWGALFGLTWLLDEAGVAWWWWLFAMPPALGFATGLARPALPTLPLTSAITVVTAYLLVVVATGVWAAQCWDCSSGGGHEPWTRAGGFVVLGFVLGLILVFTLIGIGMGVLVTRYLPASRETPVG